MSGPDQAVPSVTRQRARSGVGYATADVVIHQTRNRRVLLRPWYIPHNTQPDGLALKLIWEESAPGGGWTDDGELNLDELAVNRLRTALEAHTAVARGGEEGQFLLIRTAGLAATSDAEPAELVGAMLHLLQRRDVLARFAREDLGAQILAALQGSIRLQELRLAVDQLRELLDGGVVDEQPYQDWCSRHSWAFGNAHAVADDIRRLSRIDDVDILMPRVLTGYRDIVELKRPDHPVLVLDRSRGTVYWSNHASQAIGQCAEYIEHLAADAEHGLRGRPEIVAALNSAALNKRSTGARYLASAMRPTRISSCSKTEQTHLSSSAISATFSSALRLRLRVGTEQADQLSALGEQLVICHHADVGKMYAGLVVPTWARTPGQIGRLLLPGAHSRGPSRVHFASSISAGHHLAARRRL